MKMVKTKLALSAAIAALALSAGSANAISWTSTGLDAAPGANETLVLDFDSVAAPGYVIAGGADSGTLPFPTATEAAAPAGDATDYYYVLGGASATLLTPVALRSLSLYIGSLDDYNTITFWSGANSWSYNGLQLQVPANGDQGSPATNRRFYFDFEGVAVDRIDFASRDNSFEFDNIAVSAVPEPGVWALMIAGFGMLGSALRRRRTAIASLA